jgi:multicomponent K+:H+ antiporter subunit F
VTRVLVAITGASGAVYGVRLVQRLLSSDVATEVIVSRSARRVLEIELGLLRLMLGPSAQDRVLALDFMFVVAMLVMLVLAIRYGSSMYFEGALLMAMFGFVSSVALAKFLLRGEVIE